MTDPRFSRKAGQRFGGMFLLITLENERLTIVLDFRYLSILLLSSSRPHQPLPIPPPTATSPVTCLCESRGRCLRGSALSSSRGALSEKPAQSGGQAPPSAKSHPLFLSHSEALLIHSPQAERSVFPADAGGPPTRFRGSELDAIHFQRLRLLLGNPRPPRSHASPTLLQETAPRILCSFCRLYTRHAHRCRNKNRVT